MPDIRAERTREEVFAEVRDLLMSAFSLEAGEIAPDASFRDLDIDSMDFLDFLSDLGQRMDRRLSARDFAGVRTVGDLVGILTGEVKPSSLVLGIRNKDHEEASCSRRCCAHHPAAHCALRGDG